LTLSIVLLATAMIHPAYVRGLVSAARRQELLLPHSLPTGRAAITLARSQLRQRVNTALQLGSPHLRGRRPSIEQSVVMTPGQLSPRYSTDDRTDDCAFGADAVAGPPYDRPKLRKLRFLMIDNSLTLVVSPSARQSGEFVRKAAGFARLLGMPVKGDGDNEISLAFPNQSRIVGLPGNEPTVRGFSAVSLVLVDEASRVSDDLYKAIRPTLAVSAGALWLMSTPFGSRGFFWEAWQRGGPEWERVRVPAYECPRIQRAFLEEERATLGERWFRQEYLCEFVDSVSGVFERNLVEEAITGDFEPLRIL